MKEIVEAKMREGDEITAYPLHALLVSRRYEVDLHV